jgi:TolB-like protein/tetratricopeptide (TPR) repeat protein
MTVNASAGNLTGHRGEFRQPGPDAPHRRGLRRQAQAGKLNAHRAGGRRRTIFVDATVFTRMRQRKVVQWGLAYLASAWLLVQVFDLVGQQFDWPAPMLRAITVLLGFGLLPALVIAWYHGEKGAQRVSRQEFALLVVLLVAGGTLAWWSAQPRTVDPVELAMPADFSPLRIAVLPFEDFSPDSSQRFLGDGIAETLLRVFTQVEELQVIARTSAFAYRGRDVATIARDLEVGTILEGSVQRVDDRLRIVAQLVRTRDQLPLWSLTFDRQAGDIFAIQDEIAGQVIEALLSTAHLGIEGSALPRTDPQVYDLYLEGRELWQAGEPDGVRRAVELLEQAVELDPTYGPAHSELATALHFLIGTADVSLAQVRSRIEAGIARALEIDPRDAQAHAIQGLRRLNDWQVADGRSDLQRAVALHPNDARYLAWLGLSYHRVGLVESAGLYYRRAMELDPMHLYARTRVVEQLSWTHSEEALALARQTVRLFPDATESWRWLINTHEQQGDTAAAVLAAVDALGHVDNKRTFVNFIASGFNSLGEYGLADQWRARSEALYGPVPTSLPWHIRRGELERLPAWAEQFRQRAGQSALAQLQMGRALVATARYKEAMEVLDRVVTEGPDLADFENVGWVHLEAPSLLAGLAHRSGDAQQAARLDQAVQAVIRHFVDSWPEGEDEHMFRLDVAMGRVESAAARLEAPFARRMSWQHPIEKLEWYAELRATDAGRRYLERMREERAAQVERLREAGIPWLFEPETWPAAAGRRVAQPSGMTRWWQASG